MTPLQPQYATRKFATIPLASSVLRLLPCEAPFLRSSTPVSPFSYHWMKITSPVCYSPVLKTKLMSMSFPKELQTSKGRSNEASVSATYLPSIELHCLINLHAFLGSKPRDMFQAPKE